MITVTKKSNSIVVEGNIKNLEDVGRIRDEIESYNLKGGDSFSIEIKDSFAMPSALIGYLIKLIQKDNINLSMCACDDRLLGLLDDLGLIRAFNVKSTCMA